MPTTATLRPSETRDRLLRTELLSDAMLVDASLDDEPGVVDAFRWSARQLLGLE